MRPIVRLALLLCCSGDCLAREWFTLELEGQRAGFAYREHLVGADGGSTDAEFLVLELAQGGGRPHVEQSIDIARDASGRLIEVRLSAVAGTAHTSWRGTLENGALRIDAGESGGPGNVRVPFAADAIFPVDEPALLKRFRDSGARELDYTLFDPVLVESESVHAHVVEDAPAAARGALRVRTTRSVRGSQRFQDYWLGADGSVERIQAQFIGLTLAWVPCRDACDRPVDPPFEPMSRLLLRSPLQIPTRLFQSRIRYVITRTDGERPRLANTAEQFVKYDGARAIVTVCAECDEAERADASELERYLAPNAWVQSDAPEIRELAGRGGAARKVERRMRELAWIVHAKMRGPIDYLGYADAVQALRTGSGDCTEHAVLLAALARASGIPTRVVFGLAYADRLGGRHKVFTPHAWVQAWNGRRWISYDAALGEFDATHIALAVGTGDPNEMDADFRQVRKLTIEKAGLVRR